MENKETVDVDVRDTISEYLKSKGIMRKWLAQQLKLSNTHMTLVLQKERDLTEENRLAINAALGTSF